MTSPIPSPQDLSERPELAVIAVLEHTLEITRQMLLSVWGDFSSGEDSGSPSVEYAYLEALFLQLEALEGTLAAYRRCLERSLRLPSRPSDQAAD